MVAAQETEKKERYSRKKFLASIPWDEDQKLAIDFSVNGERHVIVKATSGSGKSTFLEGVAASLPVSAKTLIISFNRHIAEELKKRVTIATVSTVNGYGLATLNGYFACQCRVDEGKYAKLAKPLLKDKKHLAPLKEILKFVQLSLTDYGDVNAIQKTADYYDLLDKYKEIGREEIEDFVIPLIPEVLQLGIEQTCEAQIVSFDDQIWMPEILDIKPAQKTHVLVDELQDSSRASIAFYKRLCGESGKFIGVGDIRQTIMGFAGADPRSWQHLIDTFNPVILPLSTCRRSPVSHIELAQKLTRDIKPAPYAPQGKIAVVDPANIGSLMKPNTLILCRLTAPLVKLCLKAVGSGIKARVRGNDTGKMLAGYARRISEQCDFPNGFQDALHNLLDPLIEAQREDGDEREAERLEDNKQALESMFLAFGKDQLYVDGFCEKIAEYFCGDEENPPILLSTIHGIKGGQAHRVVILGSNWLPYLGKSKRAWQEEQEWNLLFVALTRSQFKLDDKGEIIPGTGELYFVPYPKKGDDNWRSALSHPYGGIQFPSEPLPDTSYGYDEVEVKPVEPVATEEKRQYDGVKVEVIPISELLGLKEDLSLRQSYRVNIPKESCNPESEALYKWILSLESEQINTLPERLRLKPHIEITDTSLFISKLKLEAQLCLDYYQGTEANNNPRSRYGALEEDIRDLQSYFSSAFISNG